MTASHPDGPGETPPIRPAATVALLREAPSPGVGLEVLMLRRRPELAFYGGAWVFPGGRIERSDQLARDLEQPRSDQLARDLEQPRSDQLARDLEQPRSDQLARDQQQPRSDQLAPTDEPAGTGAARRAAIRETEEEAGLRLQPEALTPFARWITPTGHARRFDTWFFAAIAPAGPIRLDPDEMDAYQWCTPAAALQARQAGQMPLPPPTFVTLTELARFRSAGEAHLALRKAPLQHFAPRPVPTPEGTVFLYQADAGYAARKPDTPGPRHRITATGDRWVYERPGLPPKTH